jgi:propionyl-CoA carboxylase beta chain
VNYAWPTAEIAVMGAEGAVDIVYKRELDKASDRTAARQGKIDEFREKYSNPYVAAERGYIDAVIQPRETRKKLIQALEMLQTKRDKNPPKKHGNIPL